MALLTLPSLFSLNEQPSERALKMGHLPTYSDNSFILAMVAERFNSALREVAETDNFYLIDLAIWANTALQPRDQHFNDTIHMEPVAHLKVGKFLADFVVSLVGAKKKSDEKKRGTSTKPDSISDK